MLCLHPQEDVSAGQVPCGGSARPAAQRYAIDPKRPVVGPKKTAQRKRSGAEVAGPSEAHCFECPLITATAPSQEPRARDGRGGLPLTRPGSTSAAIDQLPNHVRLFAH